MSHNEAQANLEFVLDWIEALRRRNVDSIAERFHPDVVWEDIAGAIACHGRDQVLAWLRAAGTQRSRVDARHSSSGLAHPQAALGAYGRSPVHRSGPCDQTWVSVRLIVLGQSTARDSLRAGVMSSRARIPQHVR
jgi:hypothetical protein